MDEWIIATEFSELPPVRIGDDAPRDSDGVIRVQRRLRSVLRQVEVHVPDVTPYFWIRMAGSSSSHQIRLRDGETSPRIYLHPGAYHVTLPGREPVAVEVVAGESGDVEPQVIDLDGL
jgi:hypothetical protein